MLWTDFGGTRVRTDDHTCKQIVQEDEPAADHQLKVVIHCYVRRGEFTMAVFHLYCWIPLSLNPFLTKRSMRQNEQTVTLQQLIAQASPGLLEGPCRSSKCLTWWSWINCRYGVISSQLKSSHGVFRRDFVLKYDYSQLMVFLNLDWLLYERPPRAIYSNPSKLNYLLS